MTRQDASKRFRISDLNCFDAAVSKLQAHLSQRPSTRKEAEAKCKDLSLQVEITKTAIQVDGLETSRVRLVQLLMELTAWQKIASNPIAEFNKTTIELSKRVAFYGEKIQPTEGN